jgi:hypothetical protein
VILRAMRALACLLVAAACGNGTTPPAPTPVVTPTPTPPPPSPTPNPPPNQPEQCAPEVPEEACLLNRGLRVCADGDPDQIGEWRYAIITPPFSPVQDITSDRVAKMLAGDLPIKLAATAETHRAIGMKFTGPGKELIAQPPMLDGTHWAIVPAHELTPHWNVLTVDGRHPLDKLPNTMAVPLCGPGKTPIRNIDPAKLTTLAMTGTTALTRGTSRLMEKKGILYPLRDVQAWLSSIDLVHISNEVSFVPEPPCDTGNGKDRINFCSKDSYIQLLEKAGARIVEMSGSHLPDYGWHWIAHTVEMYDKRGWIWFGGGRNEQENTEPRVIVHNGNKLVFIGCNMPHTMNPWIKDGPGVGACDMARIAYWIGDYKRRGYTVIVSVQHAEVNKYDPPGHLVRDLREIAKAGPAFVMGSQAHCPHPWEVHHGAHVHYGPGNFFFDQDMHPLRDSAQNKLYIHAGKLLAVGHLFARLEEGGKPRPMTEAERTVFLAAMAKAHARLPKAAPWEPPVQVPESRKRPESVLIKAVLHHLTIEVPAKLVAGQNYPAIIDLTGDPKPDDTAFVVTRAPSRRRVAEPSADVLVAEIKDLLKARYPIDPDKITIRKSAK